MLPLFLLLTLSAAPGSLAVVPVVAAAPGVRSATRLSELYAALHDVAIGRGATVLGEEEQFASAGRDLPGRLTECGPELACLCEEARPLLARQVLLLVVAPGPRTLVGLRLLDLPACRVAAALEAEAEQDEPLAPLITRLGERVLAAGGLPRLPAPEARREERLAQAAEPTPITSSPWFWVAVGAAAAGAAVASIVLLSGRKRYVCVDLPGASCDP